MQPYLSCWEQNHEDPTGFRDPIWSNSSSDDCINSPDLCTKYQTEGPYPGQGDVCDHDIRNMCYFNVIFRAEIDPEKSWTYKCWHNSLCPVKDSNGVGINGCLVTSKRISCCCDADFCNGQELFTQYAAWGRPDHFPPNFTEINTYVDRYPLVIHIPPTASPTIDTLTPSVHPSVPPTIIPTTIPTSDPTVMPTYNPTIVPTVNPTLSPSTSNPTKRPSLVPTLSPTIDPSRSPTKYPTRNPSNTPSVSPTHIPTINPTDFPTEYPSEYPTQKPTSIPTESPSNFPTIMPTFIPTKVLTNHPSYIPSAMPSDQPTTVPSYNPSWSPTAIPTYSPSLSPSVDPTFVPSVTPSNVPSNEPDVSSIETMMTTHNNDDQNELEWVDVYRMTVSPVVYGFVGGGVTGLIVFLCVGYGRKRGKRKGKHGKGYNKVNTKMETEPGDGHVVHSENNTLLTCNIDAENILIERYDSDDAL